MPARRAALPAAAWPVRCRTAAAPVPCPPWAAAVRWWAAARVSSAAAWRPSLCCFFEPALKKVVRPPPLPIEPPDDRSPAVSATTAITNAMAAVARDRAERDPAPRGARRRLAVDAHGAGCTAPARGGVRAAAARRLAGGAGASAGELRRAERRPVGRPCARDPLGRAVHRLADQRHQDRRERRGDPGAGIQSCEVTAAAVADATLAIDERPHVQAALLLALAELSWRGGMRTGQSSECRVRRWPTRRHTKPTWSWSAPGSRASPRRAG